MAETQAAVIHELLVIGEASKRLTAEFKDLAASVDVPGLLQILAPLAPKARD